MLLDTVHPRNIAPTSTVNLAMSLLDQFDVRILRQLQDDARVSNVKLASAVGLSPSPCLRRVRELMRRGIIRRQVALVDPDAVGLPVSTFIQVTLDKQVKEALDVFESAVREQPEVMECYLMTGEADYLLRVVTPSLAAYHRFLMERLTRIPGIARQRAWGCVNWRRRPGCRPVTWRNSRRGRRRIPRLMS